VEWLGMHEAAGENSDRGTEAMTLLLLSAKEQFGARGAATILALAAYASRSLSCGICMGARPTEGRDR